MGVDLYREGVEIPEAVRDRAADEAWAEAGDDVTLAAHLMFRRLEATGAYYRLNSAAWEKALILAHKHGWQPRQPAEAYWYTTVDADEARELAEAVEAARAALEDVEAIAPPMRETDMGDGAKMIAARRDMEPEAFFASVPERLEGLAMFARGGAFRIE